MKVVILVPIRRDNGWRDRLWEFCKEQWKSNFPDWPIFEGHHEAQEGPFNRSMAINRAASLADGWLEGWDVALVIDADTISEPEAVRKAVQYSWETGALSIGHNARLMLTRRATNAILTSDKIKVANNRQSVKKTYYDSISCAVAVRKHEWDAVGGFDEHFEGWGFEDTAFRIAVETMTTLPIHIEKADCLHLWHESSPEASQYAPTYAKNHARKLRYEQAHFQQDRLLAILHGRPDPGSNFSIIPKIIHRTVPEETPEQIEVWWAHFHELHPQWQLKTWRDPLNIDDFPIAGHLHSKCANGAQKAGLIRLELLVTHGGVYVDSDVEAIRALDSLVHLPAFAAWEDEKVVPDAVLGAAPNHPAFREMLYTSMSLIENGSVDAWETGPGVTTSVLPGREDVLLLPPGSFYPVHYREKSALGTRNKQPWVFLEHKWHHSWSPQNQRRAAIKSAGPAPTPVELLDVPQDVKFAICMPWKEANDHWREEAHDWCLNYWAEQDFPLFQGTGANRAAMCNNAAEKAIASGANVLVFADADTWAPYNQVIKAVITASESGKLTYAFTKYVKVDQGRTRQATKTHPTRVRASTLARAAKSNTTHVSGLLAIPVDLWKKIGGFDERFSGWGFEDQAFHLAAEVVGEGHLRIEGTALHWYHRSDPTKGRTVHPQDPRLALIAKYCQAAGTIPKHGRVGRLGATGFISIASSEGNAKEMQKVLAEPGGPLSSPDVVS